MSFRIVFIENDVDIRIKLENLVINKDGNDIWIPLKDISMIVLDNLKISISTRILAEISNNNIGLMLCNHEHVPIGYYSSYDNHNRASKMLKCQIEKEQFIYDEIWKKIVIQKIINQQAVLTRLNKDSELSLLKYANDVMPGDPTNREAHAAKVYFNTLMGNTFSRGNGDILLNSGLDYGYSVVRSYLARLCVGYGLNSQIGIHHKNEYNRFNLVDDLIEPVRPIVDIAAYKLLEKEEYFKQEHRHKLVDILNHRIIYNDKKMYISNALEEYISQFAAYIGDRGNNIIFPELAQYIGGEEDEI